MPVGNSTNHELVGLLYRDHRGWLLGWLRRSVNCPQRAEDLVELYRLSEVWADEQVAACEIRRLQARLQAAEAGAGGERRVKVDPESGRLFSERIKEVQERHACEYGAPFPTGLHTLRELLRHAAEDRGWLLDQLAALVDELGSLKATIVHTLGGTVEGLPTQRINWLQRARQLCATEQEALALKSALRRVVEAARPLIQSPSRQLSDALADPLVRRVLRGHDVKPGTGRGA